MKVEPLRIESAVKRASPINDDLSFATQQNNWLQNEVVQSSSSSVRANQSVKSLRLQTPVVQTQPMPVPIQDVMPVPVQNCPPGLEYLATIDQLLVQQKVELIEAITGFETNNKFNVKNSMGQKVYWAAEVNDCCTRNCCGPLRRFKMKVYDAYQNEVIHLRRPAACDTCCFPCCLQSIKVYAPPSHFIGSVQQKWSILYPHFVVKNEHNDIVFRIKGPICTYSVCGKDVEFKVLSSDGTQVGKISKQWSGLARELFTDADFFGISFPLDLNVQMKAILMGACFLIDSMFFEKAGHAENDRPGMI